MASVTENGPEGYDYQYLGSIYVILHFLTSGNLSEVYIDKLGKEDLTLCMSDTSGIKKVIEVQFKKRSSSFNQEVFISCISKFSARKNDENILSRIMDGSVSSFYILTSGVTDGFSAKLNVIANASSLEKSNDKRDKKVLISIINALDKEFRTATTIVQKARKKFILDQQAQLTKDKFSLALDNVILIDRLSKNEISRTIALQLSELLIPISAQRSLIFELLEIIKDNRGKGINILPSLERLVAAYSKNLPAADPTFLIRGNEQQLIDLLKKDQVLLLTGLPLCGKTQMALYISQELTAKDKTIEYFATTSMREAEKILYDNSFGARVCYLEDPISINGEESTKYRQLESLIANLPKGRKRFLIVTESIDEKDNLSKNGYLNGLSWYDLTVYERGFLITLWASLRNELLIPAKLEGLLKDIIEDSSLKEQVQPGQLLYLAKNFQRLKDISREPLLHFINFRAQDITDSILREPKGTIGAMMIMGATSSTQHGIQSRDVLYFGDLREDYFPSINKKAIRTTGSSLLGTVSAPDYHLEDYADLPATASALDGMSSLIDRGYIVHGADQYRFAHPIYREAARKLFDPKNPVRFAQAIVYLRKGISCMNPAAAIQSVRNLTFVTGLCNDDGDKAENIFEIAELGLSSTFVGVRDLSLLFLIDQFPRLSTRLQNRLKETVRQRTEFSSDIYVWQNDIAFIPDVEHLEKEWGSSRRYRDRKETIRNWKAFIKSDVLLNAREAWDLINALSYATKGKKQRISYEVSGLKRFLRFNESFIREKAAFLIAASVTDTDFNIVKEIFAQGDSLVNYQLVKGLFRSWPYFKATSIKEDMQLFMANAYDNLFVVLSSIELFSQFSAGHSHFAFDWMYDIEDIARAEMWYLWGELMPVFFKHLPASIRINSARFDMTFLESEISANAVVSILEAYVKWLRGHIKDEGYHTSLADTSIRVFSDRLAQMDEEKRLALIQEFLTIQNEVFQAKLWRHLVSNWQRLGEVETQYLNKLVPDLSSVIKCVILTTDGVDGNLQHQILGFKLTGKTTEEIIGLIPKSILLSCLVRLYIEPPFYDFEFKDLTRWDKILGYYLDKPEHPAFQISIRKFFSDILVFGIDRHGLWDEPNAKLESVLLISTDVARKTIFYNLVEDLSGTTGSRARPYLELLVKYLNEDEINNLEEVIDNNIEAISVYNNLNKIPPPFGKRIRGKLSFDLTVMHMIGDELIKDMGEEGASNFAKFTVDVLKRGRIRTLQAIDSFRDWARKNSSLFKPEDLEVVENYMTQLQEKGSEQRLRLEQECDNRCFELIPDHF